MMATSCSRPRFVAVATAMAVAGALSLLSSATAGETIRVWKIGSPDSGDTPPVTVPLSLRQESTRSGFRITVEAFPARGFAAMFFDAVARNAAPDVLAFDNFGVMNGMTTGLGRFDGIGAEPAMRQHFVQVTGAFDQLLGRKYGWTYLFALSPNHAAARALALTAPPCPNGSSGTMLHGELAEIVPRVATAHLEGDAIGVQGYSDPDRLLTPRAGRDNLRVGGLRPCGLWGNERLAVALVNASYEAETTLGHRRVLLVLRKPSFQWRLLVAARDPISTDGFVNDLPRVAAVLAADAQSRALPIPATLLSPASGDFPTPLSGERFGTFKWRSSPSADVVTEIAEFAYKDDARLFVAPPKRPESRGQLSSGQLWHTGDAWYWRIWSVSRAGDVAFSEARTFRH